jgi:IS30 family transposase
VTADINFTRSYRSPDKGTVENRIDFIRSFFPKKAVFLIVTKKDIKLVEKN